jgi:hypothetical protein
MAGIGQQGDRVGGNPINDLRHDEDDIERGSNGENGTKIGHAVRVIVVVMVAVDMRHAPLMRRLGVVTQSHLSLCRGGTNLVRAQTRSIDNGT